MITVQWVIADSERHCFLCGSDFNGRAGMRMTSALARADGVVAINQVAFCRGCFTTMRQACSEAESPCVQFKAAA